MPTPIVFISYSHKDEVEKEQLVSHLKVLENSGLITLWVDDKIEGGADWETEIKQKITQANLVILLISANFLTSEFILKKEVPDFLNRRQNEGLKVFPVIAKSCAWDSFHWLAEMNVRPKNATPIWNNNQDVDNHLAVITREIREIVKTTGSSIEILSSKPKEPHESSNFERIEPYALGDVSVVAQSLDNQWVPRPLLYEMLKKGLDLNDVKDRREKYVRAEYLRALINARQVVINRAYIYNNPVVFKDYLSSPKDFSQEQNRTAFKELLETGVIIPFLFRESSPVDKADYKHDAQGFPAWQEISQETRMRCLRLSWGDNNSELIREQLGRRFHSYAQNISVGDMGTYLSDLDLPDDANKPFRSRLRKISEECLDAIEQQKYITREQLYSKFITVDNSDNTDGKYDKSKPFAAEIKQLLDLNYNINLPDVIGGYALTPSDSIPRASLQELTASHLQKEMTAENLFDLFRRLTFDLVQQTLCPKSIGSLSLSQVQEIRHMDEWVEYIASLEQLLENPQDFAEEKGGAPDVYRNYIKVTEAMSKMVPDSEIVTWHPTIEVEVIVAGATSSFVRSEDGHASYKFSGAIPSYVASNAPVTGRLKIRNLPGYPENTNLVTDFDFLKGRMPYPQKEWEELEKMFKNSLYTKINVPRKNKQKATVNQAENLRNRYD